MSQILRKFILYFTISSLIYYIFLIVEAISLYFNEFGFDIINAILFSFSQIASVINFGVFIALILVTADLLKEKVSVSNLFKFGLIISLIFGGLIFLLSNKVAPELKLKSYLIRYENKMKRAFSPEERIDREGELKKKMVDMMSIGLINQYSDSLENENKSQKRIISKLFQKIPDSIVQSDFSKKELNEYNVIKNNLTSEFNRRDLFKLKNEISKNQVLIKQLKQSYWTKNERYINGFLTIFLVCFGIVIGANFKNQLVFSLVCIGIVIYSQTLTLLSAIENYSMDEENSMGLIFKLSLIIIVFLYLLYRLRKIKNTSVKNG